MKVKPALILFVFVVSSVTPAFAGWKLTMASPRFSQTLKAAEAANPAAAGLSKMPGFDTITVLIDNDKVKLFFPDNWAWAIIDYTRESFALGVDAGKARDIFTGLAAVMDKEKGAAAIDMSPPIPDPPQQAVAGTVDDLISALDIALAPAIGAAQAAIANIPPDQLATGKAQMQAGFDKSASYDLQVNPKTDRIPIAGCNTTGYDMIVDGKHTMTVWYCTAVDTETIKKKSQTTTKKFTDWLQSVFDKMSGGLGVTLPIGALNLAKQQDIYDRLKGFPFEVTIIDAQTGEPATALVVTDAKQMKIPATEFAVPMGYKVTSVKDAIANLSALIAQQMARRGTTTASSPDKKKSHGHTIVMNNNELK